jgi:hypothetical protein
MPSPVETRTKNMQQAKETAVDSLPTRTPILPDIPHALEPFLGAHAADIRARDALIVAVVPFADVLGNLDTGVALGPVTFSFTVGAPRVAVFDA